jgi:hypothetical protein
MSAETNVLNRPLAAHARILDQYAKQSVQEARPEPLPDVMALEPDTTEDAGCFGFLRGTRDSALMLELRKKDGSIMAISYSYIERLEFEPSEGITIHALGRTIRIHGTNLNAPIRPGSQTRLFEGITRHRVLWVAEERIASSELERCHVAGVKW